MSNAFHQLKGHLEADGFREIENDIDGATGDSYMIFEEEDTGRRYKITIEEI